MALNVPERFDKIIFLQDNNYVLLLFLYADSFSGIIADSSFINGKFIKKCYQFYLNYFPPKKDNLNEDKIICR